MMTWLARYNEVANRVQSHTGPCSQIRSLEPDKALEPFEHWSPCPPGPAPGSIGLQFGAAPGSTEVPPCSRELLHLCVSKGRLEQFMILFGSVLIADPLKMKMMKMKVMMTMMMTAMLCCLAV